MADAMRSVTALFTPRPSNEVWQLAWSVSNSASASSRRRGRIRSHSHEQQDAHGLEGSERDRGRHGGGGRRSSRQRSYRPGESGHAAERRLLGRTLVHRERDSRAGAAASRHRRDVQGRDRTRRATRDRSRGGQPPTIRPSSGVAAPLACLSNGARALDPPIGGRNRQEHCEAWRRP